MSNKKFKNLNRKAKRSNEISLTFSERFKQKIRKNNVEREYITYNYHTNAFFYFREMMEKSNLSVDNYRAQFWKDKSKGVYSYDQAQKEIGAYKTFLESKMQGILENYSIGFWLHVSRRLAPSAHGDDQRPETIQICRNIITAAIQKYGQLKPCGNLRQLAELNPAEIFNGLFLTPGFENDLAISKIMPDQLVLVNFNETNMFEYYQLEKLAFEIWFSGAKSRVISKGADLVVDHESEKLLQDNRTDELDALMLNYDNRLNHMSATATGTVFEQPNMSKGLVLLTQIFANRPENNTINILLEHFSIKFPPGHFPNYEFVVLDLKTYLEVHMSFALDFEAKCGAKLEYVIMVIADISLSLAYDIYTEKDSDTKSAILNALSRSYRLYSWDEYRRGLVMNWDVTSSFLDLKIGYDELEVVKALNYLTLSSNNKVEIFVDTFGPMKLFIPAGKKDSMLIDHSLVGDILYNLFSGLPLTDRGFKGDLLESALKTSKSFLPTSECKGFDGTSKQVDFSVAHGDILILAECKAVARSFGVFSGQNKAIQHRLNNVIDKGLDDVDDKIKWLKNHPSGTNYDIRSFKYMLGIAVSAFPEFMPTKDPKYWINEKIPRTLTVGEFEELLKTDLSIVRYNLISIQ